MKEYLKDLFIAPFVEMGWEGYILGILVWIIGFIIIGFLGWLGIWLVDSSFMPIKEKEGIVENKYIIPAHTTTTFIYSGKVLIPITTYHSTAYELDIKIDNLQDDVSVDESYYDGIHIGQKLLCKYTNGRIRDRLYIKEIE